MQRKQQLTVRSHKQPSRSAQCLPETLEQQVRENPVVQEMMNLFQARIVSVVPSNPWEGNERRNVIVVKAENIETGEFYATVGT